MNERDFHDRHYASEAAVIEASALFTRVHDRAARQFLRASGIGPGQRLLSIGCGDGAIELRLASHVGEVTGVDISGVAVARARLRARAAGVRNAVFAESDGSRLAEFGAFDAVAAFAFLHHLDDRAIAATLLAARRALPRGGVFYSTDPSRRRLVGLFAGLVRAAYERHHSPDERELDPGALAGLAAQAGFVTASISYTDYFLGPLAWLAPRTPSWLGSPLEVLDNAALHVPLLRRYASSFSLLARAAP